MMIWLITIPFIAGVIILLLPARIKGLKEGLALLGAGITFVLTILLFLRKPLQWSFSGIPLLRLDSLSAFILLGVGLFGFLIMLYSLRFMAGKSCLKEYYAFTLFTLGAAYGALLASHLLLLLIFWGILGITLYLLIGLGGPAAAPAAKKAFIIVGGSDALLLLGIVIVWSLTGRWGIGEKMLIPLRGGAAALAFSSFLIAALAKVGAMPFHTWLPVTAEKAPVPVAAFLPASLDKLLGIYLLARICLDLFQITSGARFALMLIGAVTIVAAVMMALIQHDAKRLLGFHAVSQAGYMILGIGTGTVIGIAGGLFHMLNNAVYKQGLFLAVGAVEKRKGTTDLDKLGGLVKIMPLTFIFFLIAALAISGIPPLNGFVSKWMVYQGLIEMGEKGTGLGARLWVVWLLAAMFGSALTLASFMKLLYAIFLGKGDNQGSKDEVSWVMWAPMAVLALLCVVMGVFAFYLPIKVFLAGSVPGLETAGAWLGGWRPGLATGMIAVGLIVGWVVYKLGNLKGMRVDKPYIGGEPLLPTENRVTGTEFYNTIKELGPLKVIYKMAGLKYFDIYDLGSRLTFWISDGLKTLHDGVLPTYLSWCLLGMIVFLIILIN
ncbi:MAG: proton-conducting transporter membrane subunit [PVC group bacterium]